MYPLIVRQIYDEHVSVLVFVMFRSAHVHATAEGAAFMHPGCARVRNMPKS